MKVQFCFNYSDNIVAEFDVEKMPTKEQCDAIEDYIYNKIEKWEEENDGDFSDFDYWYVCRQAAEQNLKLLDNPVVKTFYI